MRRLMCRAALCFALLPAAGAAQDFWAGLTASNAGDYAAALSEWMPLAEQGNASAQNSLGLMYADGRGVPQDDAEAARWPRMAAEQGDAFAQFNLRLMYELGRGVPQDHVSAHMWFNLAAANGFSAARELQDSLAARLAPADLSEAQRRARVCMASDYRDCD